MPVPDKAHADRGRAESFGSVAADYDRFRPSYPPQLIDDLVALHPGAVLDVGCGTGKAAVPLAAGGLNVLGVEIDPRMAELARSHGVAVEVAGFEAWDDAGRTFDLLVSGQAWHWVDPDFGIAKAARVLRPGGTAALFWNYDEPDPPVQDALDAAYRAHAPELTQSVATGRGWQPKRPYVAEFGSSADFAAVTERTYRWERAYSTGEWLALIQTHSDHLRLPPDRRDALLDAITVALARFGDMLTVHYGTYTVLARRS